METNHKAYSPDPWHVGFYKTTHEFRKIEEHVAITNDRSELIAITGPTLDNNNTTIQDARLIAAAPELYRMLEWTLGKLESGDQKALQLENLYGEGLIRLVNKIETGGR